MISRKFHAIRSAAIGALLLCLAACAAPVTRPVVEAQSAQDARQARLSLQPDWSFSGRVAVSDGANAGNARIEWRQHGPDFEIRLSAPITGQSWTLRQAGTDVSLEGLAGGLQKGAGAEALLQQATGWRIPIQDMSAWVRGLRAGDSGLLEFSPEGLPATLQESGWGVEYRAWNRDSLPMPTKLFARSGQASVRLVIERWGSP